MRYLTLLAAAVLGSSLAAQTTSSTLPKGWDTKEGVEVGTTTNTYFWTNFDNRTNYAPSKSIELYSSKVFPWDPTKSQIITKLSFRRDGSYQTTTTTAHTKKWVIIMSTSTVTPASANFNYYDGNHGKDRTVVFGAIGTPKTVNFLATPTPTTGTTAPFDVVVTLDKAFVVPANSKTLVVEIRTYG